MLDPADRIRLKHDAEYPWCREQGCVWRAERTLSAACPIHDPAPYKRRTDRELAQAIDLERRRTADIYTLADSRRAALGESA